MSKKTYNKLVRDNIPEIVQENGGIPQVRKLKKAEFQKKLLEKLTEEVLEVAQAADNKKDLIKELGDVQEVMTAIYRSFGVECGDVTKTARKRRKERGAFDKQLLLESVVE